MDKTTLNPARCYADGRHYEARPAPASGGCKGCAADGDCDLCYMLDRCSTHTRPDRTDIVWEEKET